MLSRLGDIEIPIGQPWFGVYWPSLFWSWIWPIRWQGWAMFAVLFIWIGCTVAVLNFVGWMPGDWFFYGWLLPTFTVWVAIVGAKTEVRSTPRDQ
jgi:hypothetical protein